jgi:hypothetical protein
VVRHSSLTPARILTRNGDASLSRHVAPEVAAVAFLTSDEAGDAARGSDAGLRVCVIEESVSPKVLFDISAVATLPSNSPGLIEANLAPRARSGHDAWFFLDRVGER